jgi:hypothetical protein
MGHHEDGARVAERRHADGCPHVVCVHTPVLPHTRASACSYNCNFNAQKESERLRNVLQELQATQPDGAPHDGTIQCCDRYQQCSRAVNCQGEQCSAPVKMKKVAQ